MFVVKLWKKDACQYKVFATNHLTVFYRDALKYCFLGFYFLEKEMQETLIFYIGK